MQKELHLIGRTKPLFDQDIFNNNTDLLNKISKSRILVLGGAGTIGQAVVKEIIKRDPLKIHVVDISENNLVELVRDIRSSIGYTKGEFKTFALDIGSIEYDVFIENDGKYDYVLNLSACKHVRSEKDPYTLVRLIKTNIINTIKTLEQSIRKGTKHYFAVSTDKASDPVNMMGCSKFIMERFLNYYSDQITISSARFANVAFSDGSLLFGFQKRLDKGQPISAPNDIVRSFITQEEAGKLCMLGSILGKNNEIYFPNAKKELSSISFSDIALRFLEKKGLNPIQCVSENVAREMILTKDDKNWPCYFSTTDTTGEKYEEKFFTSTDNINREKYKEIGIICNNFKKEDHNKLSDFKKDIKIYIESGKWKKEELVDLFKRVVPNFDHIEMHKSLDSKM